MDSNYLATLCFIIITVIYYTVPSVGKLPITITMLPTIASYFTMNAGRLGLYFLAVVIVQSFINMFGLINKCGGNVASNALAGFTNTVLPFTFIFGAMLGVLLQFPSLKNAFSNVVGYFAISGSAETLLTEIMLDPKTTALPQELQPLSNSLIKMFADKSIFINQITVDNFQQMWSSVIHPLLKPEVNELAKQTELLDLVVLKDNVGEFFWMLYTGILTISFVSYNLAKRKCDKSAEQLKQQYSEYSNTDKK
jgi:hypothetical protein